MTLEYWEAQLGRGIGPPMPEDARIHFISRFNATEPVSNYNPAFVYLLKFGDMAVVIFQDGNCITLMNQYPVSVIRYWMSDYQQPTANPHDLNI